MTHNALLIDVATKFGYIDLPLKFDPDKTVLDMLRGDIWTGQIMMHADEVSVFCFRQRLFDCRYIYDLNGDVRAVTDQDHHSYEGFTVETSGSGFIRESLLRMALEANIFHDSDGAYLNKSKKRQYVDDVSFGDVIPFPTEDAILINQLAEQTFNSRFMLVLKNQLAPAAPEVDIDVSPSQ